MDALRAWMVEHRFLEFLPAFTDVLGVECVADLPLVTEADLPALGMKPIQARRFGRLFASLGEVAPLQRLLGTNPWATSPRPLPSHRAALSALFRPWSRR